ncbi:MULTISPECIES: hypothetical protein [unclassified Nocardia]|uniref:hypothetical protein n=1 Tax=unclassified Nocardia TaxID=2637762 RepID=UPI001CE40055|nr:MULTISPECIES: hypothetical protein [unclassified Nocardia]
MVADDDSMLYDPKYIEPLYQELNKHAGLLGSEHEHCQNYGKHLESVWGENAAFIDGFKPVFDDWSNNWHNDIVVPLTKISQQVEHALHRALSVDKNVGEGFGGH